MKFVFAPDSFKGSLSAMEAVQLLETAAKRHFPDAECICVPVADGGEGTVDALCLACGGQKAQLEVTGPMGRPVRANYALIDGGNTAVIEMAQASGLPLVDPSERDPLRATSFGTGQLIRHVLQNGARKLLIGIGGSATNDGGMGMLCALGARFTDAQGQLLSGCGEDLARVARADFSGLCPELQGTELQVICDVSNPLLGDQGATAVYGPQKGVTPQTALILESGMRNYAARLKAALGRDVASFPGAGAAGGMGAALGGVLSAKMRSGIDAVLDAVRFDALLEHCDLVVTGEGRIDRQSVAFGKVPAGVAKRCRAKEIPVVAVVGGAGDGAETFFDLADSAIVPTPNGPMSLEFAMKEAPALFLQAADRLFRILKMGLRMAR